MSGIIGYIGNKRVVPVLLEGLQRLQYRGYDSAGLAVIREGKLEIRRATGKLRNLEEVIRLHPLDGTYGIGHTRWATHGAPTEENAHPHRDCHGTVVVVHNGIIENYLELKKQLEDEGHRFTTETDTEVIAHLIEKHLNGAAANSGSSPAKTESLEEAVRLAVRQLTGVFALAIISTKDLHKIVAVRQGPPAVIGLGKDEYFVASDVPAILYHTRDLFFLADGDLAVLTPHGVRLSDFDGHPVTRRVQHITWDPILAEKGGFRHFTLKEIYEQPRAVRDTTLGRISPESGQVFLDEMEISEEDFRSLRDIKIVAAGTSRHAGLAGKIMIERLARVPVEVDYASEFRYRDPLLDPRTLTILITQSGETADTIAAQREAHAKGSKTLAICNVLGSMVPREANGTIYTHAGPEIGVGSTKTFTSQLAGLYLFAVYLGQTRGVLSAADAKKLLAALTALPKQLESVLQKDEEIEDLARLFHRSTDFLFLGRGVHFPVALEGALKMKKISYIHAEAYPAGEMKHGPNALITDGLPVVVIATCNWESPYSRQRYERTISNIKEAKARGATILALVTEGDREVRATADHLIVLPLTIGMLSTILEVVPLQLLAYHIGVLRGCDVDQPRNLAKSVTVE
ncbi:MAG: glutamine--fructose-6-phosphate transaminase (isomerizing) [Acidobacteriia bacterium]|jgi:glucosamine--fructose-6-phosphate aminotransferase (isomerizing)|nr:glutamine--fructose-6-phosphate transaminase (isomerizing) [Terriglobia bacterium]